MKVKLKIRSKLVFRRHGPKWGFLHSFRNIKINRFFQKHQKRDSGTQSLFEALKSFVTTSRNQSLETGINVPLHW